MTDNAPESTHDTTSSTPVDTPPDLAGSPPADVTVPELTPDMTGVWTVHTVGSTHIWNLDEQTYERRPGPASRGGAFAYDGVPQRITRVDIWPRVSSYFRVWYDDPSDPMYTEQFRQSSLIRMIVPHTPDDTEPA